MPPTIPKTGTPANPADIPLPGPRDWSPGPPLKWPTRFEQLEQFIDPTPQGRSRHTSVVIQNETLAERNAVIVCAGAHFIYSDKKFVPSPPTKSKKSSFDSYGLHLDYMSGPTDVEVYAGNATAFRSTDPRRLVIEVRVAVKVRFGYEGRPPYHTADFFAYFNPTEVADPKATSPTFIIGDVFFEFRTRDTIERTAPKPVTAGQFGVATPAGFYELRKSPYR